MLKKIVIGIIGTFLAWAIVMAVIFSYEYYQENKIEKIISLGGIDLNITADDLIFYKGQPYRKTSETLLPNVTDKQLIQHIRFLNNSVTETNEPKSSNFDIKTAKRVTDPATLKLLNESIDHSDLIDSSLSKSLLVRIAKDRGLIEPNAENIPNDEFDLKRIFPERDNWFYDNDTFITIVLITENKIKRITQVAKDNCWKCIKIGPIQHGDNYQKVIEKYGEPSDMSKSEDLTVWRLDYDKYNTYFALEKNQVTAVGAFIPED
ncbi:hypothetical protein [Marinicella marina]|uniref:hypothetical protein n=1 Tax=Marinicella marina TaxID=2996016 RepID=UPI0024BC184B|nr:hypothetical protein [Marinicella marina]MDJ1138750.1 hypothetical protein [Marinicella marina]